MAKFTMEQLPDTVSARVAWKKITEALKDGRRSVELVVRRVDGEDVYEFREWRTLRDDGSNKKSAKPDTDYTCGSVRR